MDAKSVALSSRERAQSFAHRMTVEPITKLFPIFGGDHLVRYRHESTPAERDALDLMFQVADIRYPQTSEFVLSTSLYCKPHDPGKPLIHPLTEEELRKPHPSVRNGSSWWREYMEPLIRALKWIPEPWTIRVHLSPDLLFLESFIKHPRVEIRVMCHTSEFTMPGMFWRYLPLDECGTVMARGADAMWPDRDIMPQIQAMYDSDAMLFRRFLPLDVDRAGFFIYRTIPGPVVVKVHSPLNFTEMAKAWLWHGMHNLHATDVALPPNGTIAPKFGMSHWARYGQDEQMLSHWLYYVAAAQGIYTVIDSRHRSHVWELDQRFLQSQSPLSSFVKI